MMTSKSITERIGDFSYSNLLRTQKLILTYNTYLACPTTLMFERQKITPNIKHPPKLSVLTDFVFYMLKIYV